MAPRSEARRDRQIQLEAEARPRRGAGIHLQRAAHCGDELAANRQPQAGARERIFARVPPPPERLEETAHHFGRYPRPVSCTENARRVRDSWLAVSSTWPSLVNLSAFVVRLSSTRFNAPGWPNRKSASGVVSRTVRPFSSAIGSTMSRTER